MVRQRKNLADQIAEDLEKAILNDRYRPGDRLPSVEHLAEEMGIGRSTLREALRMLQARGQIEIVHGSGTFVRKDRITQPSGELISFTDIVRQRGQRPTSVILRKEIGAATEAIAAKLLIDAGERVNVLKRLRLADDYPIAVETSFSAYERFPDLFEHPWLPDTSLFEMFIRNYGVHPHYSEHTIRAVRAGRVTSQLLQVKPKSPLLLAEFVTFDEMGTPLEAGRSWYSSDRFEYRVTVKAHRR
jgi:GntR family transcriptional regulator